jgi:hypothetical protein
MVVDWGKKVMVQAKRKVKKKTVVKRRAKTKKQVMRHVVIGPLLELAYARGGNQYKHKFTSNRPTLTVSMDGKQLFIEGGVYLVTPLGVE